MDFRSKVQGLLAGKAPDSELKRIKEGENMIFAVRSRFFSQKKCLMAIWKRINNGENMIFAVSDIIADKEFRYEITVCIYRAGNAV